MTTLNYHLKNIMIMHNNHNFCLKLQKWLICLTETNIVNKCWDSNFEYCDIDKIQNFFKNKNFDPDFNLCISLIDGSSFRIKRIGHQANEFIYEIISGDNINQLPSKAESFCTILKYLLMLGKNHICTALLLKILFNGLKNYQIANVIQENKKNGVPIMEGTIEFNDNSILTIEPKDDNRLLVQVSHIDWDEIQLFDPKNFDVITEMQE